MSLREDIISNLEKYKVAVRTIPSLHEIVANQKKMVEMQDLSIDDILPRNPVKHAVLLLRYEYHDYWCRRIDWL